MWKLYGAVFGSPQSALGNLNDEQRCYRPNMGLIHLLFIQRKQHLFTHFCLICSPKHKMLHLSWFASHGWERFECRCSGLCNLFTFFILREHDALASVYELSLQPCRKYSHKLPGILIRVILESVGTERPWQPEQSLLDLAFRKSYKLCQSTSPYLSKELL